MGDSRALISAVIIIILAVLFVYSLQKGIKETRRRRTEDVFGDPARTSRSWYWSILGVSSVLLIWFYFSWGMARSFFPESANEICQVAKVEAAVGPIAADLPTGERFFKGTVLLQRNKSQLEDLSAQMNRLEFTPDEQGQVNAYIAEINAFMAQVSSDGSFASEARAELAAVADGLNGVAGRLAAGDYRGAPTPEALEQPKWGTTADEIPLLPVTERGVGLDAASTEIEALAARFTKVKNLNADAQARVTELRAQGRALAGQIDENGVNLSSDAQEDRVRLVRNVSRVFTRISGGRIFPPEALDGVENGVDLVAAATRDQQGGLRVVNRLFFNGGRIIKGNVACSEQGSGRWLPKPADVVAVVGKMANPNEGYKGVPLFWYQWVPLSSIVGFFVPDFIADMIPGEYPVHNDDGSVTPNTKSKVLAFATGEWSSPSIPLLTGHIWDSIFRVLMGLSFGILLGVPLGILMGVSRFYKGFFDPLVELYRPVPPLAWAPLILTIFGIQDDGKIFLLFMVAFAIMVISARTGATGTQLSKIRASHSLGASQSQMLRHVILPNAMPEILTGTRIAIGVCWGTLVAAEMLAGTTGIGFVENVARKQSDYEVIWVTILIMGLLGLFFDLIMRWLIAKIIPWRGKG